jgi:NTE family protein
VTVLKLMFLTFFLVSFFFQSGSSQTVQSVKTEYRIQPLPFGLLHKIPIQKPKVALVLSGGGARGAAQLGVIKALEENNIDIDLLIGTSFGSIVGGLYASGYSIRDLDSILALEDWVQITTFTEKKRRTDLFVDQKITEDRNILTLRLDGLSPVIPTSISFGQQLTNFLNLMIIQAPIHAKQSFDELLIPFRAVCTDLRTGKAVVLSEGDLSEAMRASSSVSFLLSPIERDTLLLADGGLVANIPVNIAKEMGADIIIAVNTTSPLRTPEELKIPWYLADQVVSIPLKQLEEKQLELADVVITPPINHSASDFTGLDSLVEIGYLEAKGSIGEIKNIIEQKYLQNLNKNLFTVKNIIYHQQEDELFDDLLVAYSLKDSVYSSKIIEDLYRIALDKYEHAQIDFSTEHGLTYADVSYRTIPKIKRILFNEQNILSFENESKLFTPLIEQPFNAKLLTDKFILFLREYRAKGLSLIDVIDVNFNGIDGTLSFGTTSGKIDSIIIIGNHKTNKSVIQREIRLHQNQLFDINFLKSSLTNLNATNLFENTFAFYSDIDDMKNLTFRVKEKFSGLVRIGVRGDNERNLQLALDVRDENFFGSATEIGFQFLGGLRNRYFGLEHRSNRVFDTFITYKVKTYYDLIDRFSYSDAPEISPQSWSRIQIGEYREVKYGLSIAVGTQVEKLGNIYVEARKEKQNIGSISGFGYSTGGFNLVGFRLGSIFDSQDGYPFPKEGILMNVFYETSQKVLGGEIGYSKIFFSYETFHTYFSNHTLIPKFVFGFGDETLPISEQFRLGGQNSFFGLKENDLRGKQIFLASLEYRFFLPVKIFFDTYFKVRYDLGAVWQGTASVKFSELRHGIGATISLDTPIGPANFSVGKGFYIRNDLLKRPLSFGPYKFYFEIGYPI